MPKLTIWVWISVWICAEKAQAGLFSAKPPPQLPPAPKSFWERLTSSSENGVNQFRPNEANKLVQQFVQGPKRAMSNASALLAMQREQLHERWLTARRAVPTFATRTFVLGRVRTARLLNSFPFALDRVADVFSPAPLLFLLLAPKSKAAQAICSVNLAASAALVRLILKVPIPTSSFAPWSVVLFRGKLPF